MDKQIVVPHIWLAWCPRYQLHYTDCHPSSVMPSNLSIRKYISFTYAPVTCSTIQISKRVLWMYSLRCICHPLKLKILPGFSLLEVGTSSFHLSVLFASPVSVYVRSVSCWSSLTFIYTGQSVSLSSHTFISISSSVLILLLVTV